MHVSAIATRLVTRGSSLCSTTAKYKTLCSTKARQSLRARAQRLVRPLRIALDDGLGSPRPAYIALRSVLAAARSSLARRRRLRLGPRSVRSSCLFTAGSVVRRGRPVPGLQPVHLCACLLALRSTRHRRRAAVTERPLRADRADDAAFSLSSGLSTIFRSTATLAC